MSKEAFMVLLMGKRCILLKQISIPNLTPLVLIGG
jgi:hypothetical protein